jgi:hypothetical protein
MMQTDVSSVHLNSTGFAYVGRTRVKGMVVSSTATGGTVTIWDSTTAAVSATYAQTAYTVTVTLVAHGLASGDRVGISFNTATGVGVSATNGNYTVTVLTSSTFTITDINSRTIAALTACSYVSSSLNGNTQWSFTVDTAAAAGTTNIVFPGEGMLIESGIYAGMTTTNITAISIFYG